MGAFSSKPSVTSDKPVTRSETPPLQLPTELLLEALRSLTRPELCNIQLVNSQLDALISRFPQRRLIRGITISPMHKINLTSGSVAHTTRLQRTRRGRARPREIEWWRRYLGSSPEHHEQPRGIWWLNQFGSSPAFPSFEIDENEYANESLEVSITRRDGRLGRWRGELRL